MPGAFLPAGTLTWMDLHSMSHTPQSLSKKAVQFILQLCDRKPSTSQSSRIFVKRHEQKPIIAAFGPVLHVSATMVLDSLSSDCPAV